jgi:NADPH:quinone reductase
MKAVTIGANGVEISDVAKPTPGAHDVLVHVRANALNRADVIMASGHMHGSRGGVGAVLGLECAGEVPTSPAFASATA